MAMMIEMVTAKVFSLALNHLSKDILSNWEVIAVNQGGTSLAFLPMLLWFFIILML